MMLRCCQAIVVLVFSYFLSGNAYALAPSEQFSDIQLRNLSADEQGYMSNTTSDGHLILANMDLSRAQMCAVIVTIEFKQAPLKASLFDVYWRTTKLGFSESQKGSFVINQNDAASKNRYLLPLCKLYGFSGNLQKPLLQANISAFRLDYPPNKNISLRVESVEFLDSQAMSSVQHEELDIITSELYERIPAAAFTSTDVIIPKLIFAFEEGIKRLASDVPFLIFWIGLIFLLKLLLLSSFVRQFKTDDD